MSEAQQQQKAPSSDLVIFEGFSGLNTQPSRYGIDDKQCFIMDGFFPAGNCNARVIPDNDPAFYTAVDRIPYFAFSNIGATPYSLLFLANGSVYSVNTNTAVATQIAPPGTILNPSSGSLAVTQWGSQYALIVTTQTNGYFLWDGTNFYSAGQAVPGIDGPGPIDSALVQSGGTGYAVGDTGTVIGGVSDATYVVLTESGGLAQTVSITSPGTFYVSGTAATEDSGGQPGTGSGMVLDLTVTTATMPSGIQGNTIATYQGHVWIGNGDVLLWSAPGSVTNFSTASGGGSLTSNDSSLRVGYTQFTSSNGYLYLFGDSSISYVAGVQTTGSPPTTSFSLQNVDPEVGTTWPDTVNVLGSNIIFANPWGAHVSFGGRAAKVSGELDGVYNTQPNFGGLLPSAAKAILFGKRVWVLLLPVIDQVTFQPVNKFFLWDEKRWCSTQQSATIIFCQYQEINSVLTAWGTDGNSIYRLFQSPSSAQTKTLQSKIWAPFSYVKTKAENRIWGIIQFYSGLATTITISVDSEFGSDPNIVPISPGGLIWTNNTGGIISWTNNLGQPLIWSNGAGGVVVLEPFECAQKGALVGLTVSTNAQDLAILSISTMPVDVGYRG